jgi:hypothetical protein
MAVSTGVTRNITVSASTGSSSSGVSSANLAAAPPTSFTVASETDLNAALLAIDLTGTSSAPDTAYTIDFTSDVILSSDLCAIDLSSGDSLTINGGGHTLDGGGVTRGFFDYAGAVAIDDLAIDNAVATGGTGGGGGGGGLGGGLFVASAGTVALDGVTFSGDQAIGGNGGFDGGGGGMGGDGNGGGGGIGALAAGANGASDTATAGGGGIVIGAASGGGPMGGQNGGGGSSFGVGSPYDPPFGGSSGGGIGGEINVTDDGGVGGFGGGGGDGDPFGGIGGAGGFGGGGGAGVNGSGGAGGFGGGGGDGISTGGPGGFGGGAGLGGAYAGGGGGGGGLGAGGAIFIQQGGALSIQSGTVSGGGVKGGSGYYVPPKYQPPGFQNFPGSTGGNGSAFGGGIFIQGNQQITLAPAAGQTLTISDVIADQTGSTHQTGTSADGTPLAGAGSLLIDGAGTVVLSGANTFVGGTTIQAGTLEIGTGGSVGGGVIDFASNAATLRVDGTAAPVNTMTGYLNGDVIDLPGIAFQTGFTPSYTVETGILQILDGTGAAVTQLAFGAGNGVLNGHFQVSKEADGSGTVITTDAACFVTGTRIRTDCGDVAVENLRAGDLVRTHSGEARPIRWLGYRRLDLNRHPHPENVRPIRVRAGAIAEGRPRRDLLVSPDHALFIDGVLIPARLLVNGVSIVIETACRIVTYHHVELDSHDVILAEGLPAESYLDTGDRAKFSNAAVTTLHPEFVARTWEMAACTPIVLTGPRLAAVRAELGQRAGGGPPACVAELRGAKGDLANSPRGG